MAYYVRYETDEYGKQQKVVYNCGVGFCLPFYGEMAPPGTLACDGSEISREAYSELFQVLGTKAGAGDGVSTFNLPDMRGKWMMGADAERAAGEEVAEGLPNVIGDTIMRKMADGNATQILDIFGGASGALTLTDTVAHNFDRYIGFGVNTTDGYSGKRLVFNAQIDNPIYGASAHVTPASVALLWCIIYE